MEISEKHIFNNSVYLLESIKFSRKHGVKIALDDVRFGQTYLENLIILRPDIVKIDTSCTIGIAVNKLLQDNMKRLIYVLEALEVENIIVESIETIKDLKYIRELSITKGQGFISNIFCFWCMLSVNCASINLTTITSINYL